MKLLKQITFLFTFLSLFFLIYKQSNQKGMGGILKSIKLAFLYAMVTLGLIPIGPTGVKASPKGLEVKNPLP